MRRAVTRRHWAVATALTRSSKLLKALRDVQSLASSSTAPGLDDSVASALSEPGASASLSSSVWRWVAALRRHKLRHGVLPHAMIAPEGAASASPAGHSTATITALGAAAAADSFSAASIARVAESLAWELGVVRAVSLLRHRLPELLVGIQGKIAEADIEGLRHSFRSLSSFGLIQPQDIPQPSYLSSPHQQEAKRALTASTQSAASASAHKAAAATSTPTSSALALHGERGESLSVVSDLDESEGGSTAPETVWGFDGTATSEAPPTFTSEEWDQIIVSVNAASHMLDTLNRTVKEIVEATELADKVRVARAAALL